MTLRLQICQGRKTSKLAMHSPSLRLMYYSTVGTDFLASTNRHRVFHAWSAKDRRQGRMGHEYHNRGVISVNCLDDGYSLVALCRRNVLCLYVIQLSLTLVCNLDTDIGLISDWHLAAVHGRRVKCGRGNKEDLGIYKVGA